MGFNLIALIVLPWFRFDIATLQMETGRQDPATRAFAAKRITRDDCRPSVSVRNFVRLRVGAVCQAQFAGRKDSLWQDGEPLSKALDD
jgi:hypothetical protein